MVKPGSQQLSTRQLLTHPSPSLQQDGEEKWTKGKTHGLRQNQFNKATKEIIT